ncbi:Clp protease N-terminal domain-containing protein [Hyphomicrobium sp. CS1GBMeth3]|uniref:Clp protease N-terminal domain-containing protein n=1 Tax=Hyphomicrobium sp. CS1GBMeth3 TaxID=1892845 RepID=UPI000931AAF6|nr:Clp protease N-terminal domain-containing protein [Hyphomicrobium sp. CS1GBMeth3]
MAYRGDDLNLKTPGKTPAATAPPQAADPFPPSRPRSTEGSARAAPIWVDQTLLDCCNHAYDVASAHRATEVRLEHLIYALTRNEAATEVLQAHGLTVASMRREAATVVATEIPAAPSNMRTQPRRTEIVEEALRLAAAHAARRQAPAGIADLVHVLLDSGREFPTLIHLAPALPRQQEAASPVGAFDDLFRTGPPAPYTALLPSSPAAAPQHTRIDALERSLHALTLELANERQILSGVLQDLQRELMAQREDTSRLGGIPQDKIQAVFGDRLHRLEQAFHSGRGGEAGALEERLGLLERALQGEISVTRAAVEALADKPGIDLGPLLQRLDTIEAAAGSERDRAATAERAFTEGIQTLAATVERQPQELSALVTQPLVEHLNAFAVTRDTHHAAATDGVSETHRRLEALEQALSAHMARAEAAAEAAARERSELRALLERLTEHNQAGFSTLTENITQDLTEVHDGLSRVHSEHQALASTLDTEIQGAGNAFATLASRIDALEKAAAKPIELLEGLSATMDKMHKVTVERYYRRNRLWYWLFGTDDWLAASWPSQSARIAEELRTIKS